MKKIVVMALTILMAVSLAACGKQNDLAAERTPDTENTVVADLGKEGTAENGPADEARAVKILVAYFSATNTTKGIAEQIADSLSADLYAIIPQQPYTTADLDYHDDNSRSSIEMDDPSARPAISGSVEDMEQYEIVFIGYPIWWGKAPRIVSTFVESYDFSGKMIVPFCTSGSSGVGSSASDLEALTEGAEWLPGTRLDGDISYEAIVEWIGGLGLDQSAALSS